METTQERKSKIQTSVNFAKMSFAMARDIVGRDS